ncbi:MAG: GNAT family N-acetyltransferase [Promethearchaeota archaeon]
MVKEINVKEAYNILMHKEHKRFFDFVRYDKFQKDVELGNFIYISDKKIIGIITHHIYKMDSKLYKCKKGDYRIKQIAVLPEYQRKGVGKKLLDILIEKAKKDNVKKISLSVEESNKKAISFYEKNDFTCVNSGHWNRHGTKTKFLVYQYIVKDETNNTFW